MGCESVPRIGAPQGSIESSYSAAHVLATSASLAFSPHCGCYLPALATAHAPGRRKTSVVAQDER